MRHFQLRNQKKFLGRGLCPLPILYPPSALDHPPQQHIPDPRLQPALAMRHGLCGLYTSCRLKDLKQGNEQSHLWSNIPLWHLYLHNDSITHCGALDLQKASACVKGHYPLTANESVLLLLEKST